jgi:hypothetical protein
MGGDYSSAWLRFLLIFAGLSACAYHPDDFQRPVDASASSQVAPTPPPPPIPEGEALYQLLYADEFGEAARPLGQRARILAWIHGSGLTDAQLDALIPLSRQVVAAVAEDQANREALGPKELKAYGDTYRALILAFTGKGSLSADDLERHATDLREARVALWGKEDPHRARYKRVAAVMGLAQVWVNTLSAEQKFSLSKVRFFLRRDLSALARPGHYEQMVVGTWDVGDFDTLRYAGRIENESALNIGGLWSAEAYRVRPGEYLTGLKVQALMARAVLQPGFIGAIEVALGRREPLDFGPNKDD